MDSNINKNLPNSIGFKCWPCKNNQRLMEYPSFKDTNISERRQLKKKKTLNFSFKTHIFKTTSQASHTAKRNATKSHSFLCEPPNVNQCKQQFEISCNKISCNKVNKNPL